ncbi:MAG: protein adenylyltransferase SelO [Runella sp.]
MSAASVIQFHFDNSYATLPPKFFVPQSPTTVKAPQLVIFNHSLAQELGIEVSDCDESELAAIFSGNLLPQGATPIAQAYAGHQFGGFTMLGDGRAILLGEQITPHGQRFDIQLKGSGRTPFSRRGDGKATLSAMLREYLISEAMHHLGIPTSRSLAVVATGEPVYREKIHQGAVLTRVAGSHIRCGTFEYARQFLTQAELQVLMDYVIERHYKGVKAAENPALELLRQVMYRQIDLVVHWMRVGFIHGVMNTDNMSIAGETIDYGPCAFMNQYDLQTVFSSIDEGGRYAYGNQPRILHWNLSVLANSLLPLIAPDTQEAVAMAQELLDTFPMLFRKKWLEMMAAKIGISDFVEATDLPLIEALLQWIEAYKADYTNTFWLLTAQEPPFDEIYNTPSFNDWLDKWQQRIGAENMTAAKTLMKTQNPAFIPRNHLVEEALEAASQKQDMTQFENLLKVLTKPYNYQPEWADFQLPPPQGDSGYQTFCGT